MISYEVIQSPSSKLHLVANEADYIGKFAGSVDTLCGRVVSGTVHDTTRDLLTSTHFCQRCKGAPEYRRALRKSRNLTAVSRQQMVEVVDRLKAAEHELELARTAYQARLQRLPVERLAYDPKAEGRPIKCPKTECGGTLQAEAAVLAVTPVGGFVTPRDANSTPYLLVGDPELVGDITRVVNVRCTRGHEFRTPDHIEHDEL